MADAFENIFSEISRFLSTVKISDFIDVAIIAFLIYQVYKLAKETRAGQLIKGIVVLIVLLQISYWANLNTVKYILENTMQLGLFALLIIFQPELRRALEHMGRNSIRRFFSGSSEESETRKTINEICDAVVRLSKDKTGALICLERMTKLGDIIDTGVPLNANVTSALLLNIFVVNTPLHDGAVIISANKIVSAACFLPLTYNNDLSTELGTRHRAALGLSENSDAFVIVVSEETGKISLAVNGSLTRNLNGEKLSKALERALIVEKSKINKNKLMFWKGDKENEENSDE